MAATPLRQRLQQNTGATPAPAAAAATPAPAARGRRAAATPAPAPEPEPEPAPAEGDSLDAMLSQVDDATLDLFFRAADAAAAGRSVQFLIG